jgi:hypothetical protein
MAVIEPLWYITTCTTLWSGLGYLDGSGLKVLREAKEKKEKAKK